MWKINSLFKEFKCSLPTMVDFAVTKYFLKSNQKKKDQQIIQNTYFEITLKLCPFSRKSICYFILGTEQEKR